MTTRKSPIALVVLGVVILCAIAAGGLKILASGKDSSVARSFPPVPVGVATASTQTFVNMINAIGTAKANESVVISAKVTETVSDVAFNDGDIVESDTILVELTNDEDAAELQSARATLGEARKNFQRTKDLVRSGSSTQARMEQARATQDAAQGRVNAIEARLKDRLIRAPFAGILGLRHVSRGTLVRPGEPITTLDDVSVIKLDFTVPEKYLGVLRSGMDISAKTPAFPDKTFTGEVLAIETRIDPITRAVTVRARIENPDFTLRPGLLMTVEVTRETKQAISLPLRALVTISDDIFVYRVIDNTVERVDVSLGLHQGQFTEISSGLSVGDKIIVDGVHRVRPGAPIRIVELDGRTVEPTKPAPQS